MGFLRDFSIQANNPELTGVVEKYDSLSGAISRSFHFPTENLIIFWKDCYIPICYTYEFPVLLPEILELLEGVMSEEKGHLSVTFPADTFRGCWTVDWENGRLCLHGQWDSVGGQCGDRLKLVPDLQLSRSQFLSEWRRPLVVVLDALHETGHSKATLPELETLETMIAELPKDGVHYSTLRATGGSLSSLPATAKETRTSILLSAQRALVGRIFPKLGRVDISWASGAIELMFFLTDPPTDDDKDSMTTMEAEMDADFFPEFVTSSTIHVGQADLTQRGQVCIFARGPSMLE